MYQHYVLNYYNNGFASVTIPANVETIGEGAFESCGLTSVIFAENSKLTHINAYTFLYCNSLTEIVLPDGIVYIGEQAFYECDYLVSVVLPEGLEIIADGAFYYCVSLESITIPSSVTYIGEFAFGEDVSLKEVIFAENSKHKTESCTPVGLLFLHLWIKI